MSFHGKSAMVPILWLAQCAPRILNDSINIENRYIPSGNRFFVQGAGAIMTVVYRLQVLFLQEWGNAVIEFGLRGMPRAKELVESHRAFLRIARTTRENLVMNTLNGPAGGAFRPDTQRFRHEVFLVQVLCRSAVAAGPLRLNQLPIFPRDVRP